MPELELVAYHCPQCGGNVAIPERDANVTCSFCGVVLRVEPAPEPPRAAPAGRSSREERPPAFVPPRAPVETTRALGRFEVTLLRQAIAAESREAMAFLPLDDQHQALYLLRIVGDGGRHEGPVAGPLGELALAVVKSLKERRDPGLAVKAALRALDASRAPGKLEAFVGVLDSVRSEVVAHAAGAARALVHLSVEEARTIVPLHDRGPLDRRQLRADPEAFANHSPVALAAGDAIVVTSAPLSEDEPRVVHEALDRHWSAGSHELARAVADGYWAQRFRSHRAHEPPASDVFVLALRVRGNADLVPEPDVLVATRVVKTKTFEVALAPSPDAFVGVRALPDERHQIVWIEGGGAQAPDAAARIHALFSGETGDNENPRIAGRTFVPREARALVLQLGDRHGKVSYWTRGWGPAFTLGTRSDRIPTHQQYDEGGDSWPREGARLVFPGTLPFEKGFAHQDALPQHWSGGKASCLYALAREHEELATSDAFLRALVRAARRDVPGCSWDGVAAILRTRG